MQIKGEKFTYIDLFSGCGGFSLGLDRAGLECVAAIDFDKSAIDTFRENFKSVEHVLERDLTKYSPEELGTLIGRDKVDVIIGGPPCQGFSKARAVDGSNHGPKVIADPRRLLFKNYLHFVEYFSPSIFVMENVPGIKSAAGGDFFIAIQAEARKLGYRVQSFIVKAWEYGVPQKRERQLIVGTRCDLPIFTAKKFIKKSHSDQRTGATPGKTANKPFTTLWDAIGDLPIVTAGGGRHRRKYDLKRREQHIDRVGAAYLTDVAQIHRARELTAHVTRSHSERDLRDFSRLREGETSLQAMRRGVSMEYPYDKDKFKDRYTKQSRRGLCSTIVAHLSKDGLMFIHPTQLRSLTVREAARLQSFPDWFEFPEAKTSAFRMIGNAVPPLLGRAIGRGIRSYLKGAATVRKVDSVPASLSEARRWLVDVCPGPTASGIDLRKLTPSVFKRAWYSICYLNSWLHPDGATDRDERIDETGQYPLSVRDSEMSAQLIKPVFATSGWPIELAPIAREAARRFSQGRLRFYEYYCSYAQQEGWKSRTSASSET